MGQENSKTTRPQRASRQFARTARNIRKRRDKHAKNHPNDQAAPKNWAASPPRMGK